MATWPVTLPQEPIMDGYQESLGNVLLRTNMDVGPAKVRRRSAIRNDPITLFLKLTTAELAIFKDFCITSLHNCLDTIQWVHPITGTSIDLRFTTPPVWEPAEAGVWNVTMQLEVMP
jgi:hypothetical protein